MSKKILLSAILVSLVFGIVAYVNAVDPTASPSPTVSPSPTSGGINLTCMQTAVATRDNAIISAWDTLTASIKTALQTRRDALKTAWGIADKGQRRTAIVSAWKNFRTAKNTARDGFKTSRKAVWDQFKTDASSCRANRTDTIESMGNELSF